MKYRKPIVITLAVLALIIVSSMLLMRPVELFLSKNLPLTDLKLELVRQVREGTGIEVSIKGARYEFLHGVVMSGVSARIGTGPVFFHGDNLIVHVSLLEAMKKNFRPRIRLLGGRLLLSQIERNQLLEMLKLLDKSKSGDWAIEAEGISLEKPADLMLKFSLEPGGKEVTGKIALTLNGKKVIKGEVKAVGPRAGMSYRIFDLPLVMIDDFLPSLLDGAHGTLDGRGSFSVDEMGLAYDFKGDADRFEIPLAPGWTIDPEITINGGQLWKDNIRLTANFTLKHHDIEMQMQEKLLLPGLASREIKGYWNRAPWFSKGKLGFELKSKFRAAYRDTEQFEEAKFQLTSAEMEPFKGLKIEVEDASLSLGSEIKFAGHGKLAGHAFKLGGLGAFRFGDAFPSMGSGPITLDGEIDSLQPQAIMDAATSVHSDLMKRGYTEDAERAEDSGPLWTQRRKQNTLVTTLLAGFAVQGIVNIKGIQGVTQDPIQIFVQKTAGSMSARLAYEKETFNFKAEYSIGF
ncbi:MAG: hypothetical protein K8S54_11255, partial [Spirochaetia bacterium]|nr:hypothetical protein [Spirochaetia bacterium]